MKLPRLFSNAPRSSSSLLLATLGQAHGSVVQCGRMLRALTVGILPALFLLRTTREEIYNVLWALVFGFATLNILSLGARRFEQEKGGLSFGEILAILVVLVSVVLLAWELLYVFHILPIRLAPS
ncbi:MAG: hypothetical protein LAO22_17290 [Acidobacteriia bacterium]|nr:hypothetical protein [Terriglobia bacterium]